MSAAEPSHGAGGAFGSGAAAELADESAKQAASVGVHL